MASPFVTDLVALFTNVATQIAGRRAALGLPALVAPASAAGVIGGLMFGKEYVVAQQVAPRIVLVPTGTRYEPIRRAGIQQMPATGQIANVQPKARELRWLQFDAHLWGDPDQTFANALQDWNACLELEAELVTALYDNCGNQGNVRLGAARFDQPADLQRYGRLMILPFEVGTNITDLPYTILPYANPGPSGVSVHTTMETVFPDGSSSIAGVIIAPPP